MSLAMSAGALIATGLFMMRNSLGEPEEAVPAPIHIQTCR